MECAFWLRGIVESDSGPEWLRLFLRQREKRVSLSFRKVHSEEAINKCQTSK